MRQYIYITSGIENPFPRFLMINIPFIFGSASPFAKQPSSGKAMKQKIKGYLDEDMVIFRPMRAKLRQAVPGQTINHTPPPIPHIYPASPHEHEMRSSINLCSEQ